MQIIILLSGHSQRFFQAGYRLPKALLEIDGKPMIEHIVNLFPKKSQFLFLCREDHLAETPLKKVLQQIAPTGEIVLVPPHHRGPVFSLQYALERILPQEEVIVNYCDFGIYWNYQDFLTQTRQLGVSGAIVAYRGFHPHLVSGTTNYAFLRHLGNELIEVQEKKPFTSNPMREFISNGSYYFQKGSFLIHYVPLLLQSSFDVEGEFYVSLLYNFMRNDCARISLYEIQHMLQWGTPKDMEEYQYWSHFFAQFSVEPTFSKNSFSNPFFPKKIFFEETYRYWQSFFHKCPWHPYSLFQDPRISVLEAQELDRQFRNFVQNYS